jgi:uncharacterized protein
MKYLFFLNHPAHFHLFKNIIASLSKKNEVIVFSQKKDVLENLLSGSGLKYISATPKERKNSKVGMISSILLKEWNLLRYCLKNRPDLMIGTSMEIVHIGRILNIPAIFTGEDDAAIVPLVSKSTYPFAKVLLCPQVCNNGKWNKKSIKYNGYQELAYLHPNNFIPDKNVVLKYFDVDTPYFVIRLSSLKAHHDSGIKGISTSIAQKIISILEPYGKIHITSERPLEPQFEKYRCQVMPSDMHHVIYFANLFIGDSQTMAAESGLLGTPFIRLNDFVGRIGYLNEIENYYQLGSGIKPENMDQIIETLTTLINTPGLKDLYKKRREKMLNEKIDTAAFITWFIENYPSSIETMKSNPDYQYNFK